MYVRAVSYLYAFVISVHAGVGSVSLFLCATARGSDGRLEVRWNQLFKPQGSASTTTTPPTQSVCPAQASSPDDAKLRDHQAWH